MQFTGDRDWKKWSSDSDGNNGDLPDLKRELTHAEFMRGDIFETPDKGNPCETHQTLDAERHHGALEENNNGKNFQDDFSLRTIANVGFLGNPISTAAIVGENAVVDSGVTIEIFQERDGAAVEDHHDTDHTLIAENDPGGKKISLSKNKVANRNKEMVSAAKERLQRYNLQPDPASRKNKTENVKKSKKKVSHCDVSHNLFDFTTEAINVSTQQNANVIEEINGSKKSRRQHKLSIKESQGTKHPKKNTKRNEV